MWMTRAWAACRDVIVTCARPLLVGGALCVAMALTAAPAHAQARFKITDGSGTVIDATLTNGVRTLTFKGPAGTFVFAYYEEYNTATHNGYAADEGDIQMLRWPKSGRGTLIASIDPTGGDRPQWTVIGNVQPFVPTQPKPKPTPKPKPPADRFSKRSWRAHNAAILDLDINLGGTSLVSGDASQSRRWDLTRPAGQGYAAQGTWPRPGKGVAFRGTENIAMGGSNVAAVLRANVALELPYVPQSVESVAWRWDGGLLALGGLNPHSQTKNQVGTIRLYHDDGTGIHTLRLFQLNDRAMVRSMAFGPNNRYLIAAGGGGDDETLGTVTRWDLWTYESVQMARFRGVAYAVAIAGAGDQGAVAFGGAHIVGGRKAGFITLISGNDTKSESLAAPVYSLALCRDASKLAAGTGKSVLLWTGNNDKPIVLPTSGIVRSVALSKDGSKLAAGGMDGVITVWNIGSPRPVPATVPVYRLRIKVIDAQTRKPIPGVRLTAEAVGEGICRRVGWYPQHGLHLFEATQAGHYNFGVTHKGYRPQTLSARMDTRERVETIQLARDVAQPKPTPTGSIVLLKVQHQDGTIVPDPTIQFIRGPGQKTADGEASDGLLRFNVTKPGDYVVMVSKDGYVSQSVTVRADGQPKPITLQRVFTLVLSVLDADKQPIIGPEITIEGPGRESGDRSEAPRGTHTLSLTTSGTYTVVVRKQGFKEQSFRVDVRDPNTRKTITLPWGFELALAVIDSSGKPIANPTIKITGPDKETKLSSSGGVHTYALTSNGMFEVTVSKAGFETQTRKTGPGKTTFKLRAIEYELVVRVPDGGDVAVFAPKGSVVTRRIDAAYSLWLSPGTYKVSYTNDDEFTFEKEVSIQSGNAELKFESDPFPTARKLHRKLDLNGDQKLTKDDNERGWDELRKAMDGNGDGEIEVKEIAAELKKTGQDVDQPSTTPPLPAKSRPDALRHKLDTVLGTESGWAKKDLDPQTWEFFKDLDTNGDEVIDVTEQRRFTDAMEEEAIADSVNDPDATTLPAALVSLRRRLRGLDRNGDGLGRTDVNSDAWLWIFRDFDKNKNDKLDASEELAFLVEFQQVATEFAQGKPLVEALRPLFRRRDKDGNGVGDTEVDAPSWKTLSKYDTAPKNSRIDRGAEETAFLKDYERKVVDLMQVLVEVDGKKSAPPPSDKAAQLRARLKRMDTENDGLDTGDVDADTWTTLFAKHDTNKNNRLDPTEEDALVQEWKPWVEDPVDEPVAVKRRALKIRKIQSR